MKWKKINRNTRSNQSFGQIKIQSVEHISVIKVCLNMEFCCTAFSMNPFYHWLKLIFIAKKTPQSQTSAGMMQSKWDRKSKLAQSSNISRPSILYFQVHFLPKGNNTLCWEEVLLTTPSNTLIPALYIHVTVSQTPLFPFLNLFHPLFEGDPTPLAEAPPAPDDGRNWNSSCSQS